MNDAVLYSVVVPVYNEEAVLEQTYRRLKKVMDSVGSPYELIFVDDGSADRSRLLIKGFCDRDKAVKLISFSRNFGHQTAITAGMDYAAGRAVVVIDADLQDPPELIPELIAKWREGNEVVYAKRIARKGETFFKKKTAHLFYRLLRACTEIEIPVDTGDFRLIDRRVCDALKRMPERNRYVRGLVSWVGFKQVAVEYIREPRFAGETKYSLQKMLKLCVDGLTAFSFQPLKLSGLAGGLFLAAGLVYLIVLGLLKCYGVAEQGWNLVLAFQLLLSGLLLMMLGIVGEYIGRIYDETRDRPQYIVKEYYPDGGKREKLKLSQGH